jgi:hypothetical protein
MPVCRWKDHTGKAGLWGGLEVAIVPVAERASAERILLTLGIVSILMSGVKCRVDQTSQEIRISSRELAPADLFEVLVDVFDRSNQVRVELRPSMSRMRSPLADSSVLVAIVAGGSAALTTLVSGLLKILEKRRDSTGKIVVRGSDGATVEFPAGTPPETVIKLVNLARTLAEPRIELQR